MNMIEKVARALSVADGNHADACSNDEDETPAWTLYTNSAKAAIEAMREPTPEILEAALDWHDHVAADETYPMARGVIRAAVGAALEEK